MTTDINQTRIKLEKVTHNRELLMESAQLSFQQFDTDKSGTLDHSEVKNLVDRLCKNLHIPPVDHEMLNRVVTRYDMSGDGQLNLKEFSEMYFDLLCRIRDRFYPSKSIQIKRSFFVGRMNLPERQKKITDLFAFNKHLGSGSFGAAHLVTEVASRLQRVCKTISRKNAQLPAEQIEAEIQFMKALDHPNIIRIYEVYEDRSNIYIIMEPCSGGELRDIIVESQKAKVHLSERIVAQLMRYLIGALKYIHERNIAHKDLKPENIMFHTAGRKESLKVIDFGVAEMFDQSENISRNAAGTALYMAPEVFDRKFGLKCDLWSTGVILYLLLTGKYPFQARSLTEIQKKVQTTVPNYRKDCSHLSVECIDLLRQLLTINPKHRPTAEEALKHLWFQNAPETSVAFSSEVTDNIKHYVKKTELQKAMFNMVAHQVSVSGTRVKKITEIFRSLDKDNCGTISHHDLSRGLKEAGWQDWEITQVIQALDVDSSGKIDYTEFLAACFSWRNSEISVVWASFQKMDTDGDGKVKVDEFTSILLGGDRKIGTDEEVKTMVAKVDQNGDGLIDWDEFLNYFVGEDS
eukprot:GHVP01030423.1.p1 GENE.GHVP01030423.1~~GHVP01030423.1.p1  ORF type:complete len:576 (-),score=114.00 GHVP01030423.1:4157-5884(-)